MKKFPDLDNLPKYKKLRDSQPHIKNQDLLPKVINDIFSKEEIKDIVLQMETFPIEKIRVQPWGGQGVFDDIKISDQLKQKLEVAISKEYGTDLIVAECSFVKYSPAYGYQVKLFPHYDTRKEEMFILDLQLDTNEDWGIIVEGKQFNLIDGQALFFSGTQQMHWREKKILSGSADIKMMFCWLKYKDGNKLYDPNTELMKEREIVLMQETQISSEVIKI